MTERVELNAGTKNFEEYKPPITIILSVICIILFIGVNTESNFDNWESYTRWGAPSFSDIYNGSYWGLITSNFLHVEIWHIGFNLYWFYILGKRIEFKTSILKYLSLIITSAIVSSLAQLGFAESAGIGLSGIVYSYFGFLYIHHKNNNEYFGGLEQKTINLFLIWLFICIVLTQTNIWTIANAAHVGGLLWGASIAFTSNFQFPKKWIIRIISFLLLCTPIFWNPFSTSLLQHQAYKLHENQDLEKATLIYKKILNKDPNNEFAISNLNQLEIYELSKKAVELHKDKKYPEAREIYNKILSRDKGNIWAKENIKLLPNE